MYIEKLTIKNFRAFDEDGITLQFNKKQLVYGYSYEQEKNAKERLHSI